MLYIYMNRKCRVQLCNMETDFDNLGTTENLEKG